MDEDLDDKLDELGVVREARDTFAPRRRLSGRAVAALTLATVCVVVLVLWFIALAIGFYLPKLMPPLPR